MLIAGECRMGFNEWNLGVMPLGPKLSASRRLLLQAFAPQQLYKYRDVQQKSVHRMLNEMIESPSNFLSHLRLLVFISDISPVSDDRTTEP
jgi:cytochrome P450